MVSLSNHHMVIQKVCSEAQLMSAVTARILEGRAIADQILSEVKEEVVRFKEQTGITPGLAAILIGSNPASEVYVRNKSRTCDEVGIYAQTFRLPQDASEQEAIALVKRLNEDITFHGILAQMPFPPQISPRRMIEALSPDKDVDGLHPTNVGRLVAGEPLFVPCTPAGVQQVLLRSGYNPDGKRVVVCGRSEIVGKPLAILLMQKREGANATVTICHTGTTDLPSIARTADILVAAMGRPNAITADMVKEGAVVIDVGVNRVDDPSRKAGYRLVGDVDFERVKEKAAAITPVPGGVGPMTIAMLLFNTLKAARLAAGLTS